MAKLKSRRLNWDASRRHRCDNKDCHLRQQRPQMLGENELDRCQDFGSKAQPAAA
jgi:hypothetical protein